MMTKDLTRLAFLLLFTALCGRAIGAEDAEFTRTEDVIYGRKFGTALTMDIFKPKKPNGAAILFMVSGGWLSSHDAIGLRFVRPFLDRGYTVFPVVHGSQPKFHIPEIMQDVHRAVRFIRYNASKYDIDSDRLGVTGGSAGGHLSLVPPSISSPQTCRRC